MSISTAHGTRLCRYALAAAAVVVAAVFLTSGIAAASPFRSTPPVDASKLVWLTPEQHAALLAATAASGAGPSSVMHPNDPPSSPYYVIFPYSDLRGTYTPIRRGNNSFGYNHYAYSHNLTSPNPIHAAFQTHNPDVSRGAHLEYISYATDPSNGNVYLTVRVVVQAASRTDDGVWQTPDGTNIGVITAYCQSYDVCPDWVNGVPG